MGSYSFNTTAVAFGDVLSIGPCPNLLWPQVAFTMATPPRPKDQINDLVLEQIYLFKQPTNMTDSQLFEYHLRHLQIMTLYRKLDRAVRQVRYTGSRA
jgi:hypothetical protein